MASIFLAFIDLVAGIPSVIFGFIGLTVLVKAFATHLHMAAGQCILAAGIVLGIMLLPFVISTCHESLQTARKTYEFSAITLGFSREFTLLHFILPAIRPGIIAGAMMAFGRALGETMAVMMVIGNSPIYPNSLDVVRHFLPSPHWKWEVLNTEAFTSPYFTLQMLCCL